MSLRRLRIPALLILAFPAFAHAQSLGDASRQVRAEQQQSGASHLKVYTNDDLTSHSSDTAADQPSKEGDQSAPAESAAQAAGKTAAKAKSSPDKEHEARELEIQKRTQEINQQYLGRIAAIRTQITAAQQTLAQLQRDQVESANLFRSSVGAAPSIPEYEQQQRLFSEQIEAQRNAIVTLNSQLDDAQESARHAGVPHATD
jgi:hypothetical protein